MLGKATLLVLGINQPPVDSHVEDAVAALDEFRLDAKFLLDRGRQTGGLGQVVSHPAVFDGELHRIRPDLVLESKVPNKRSVRYCLKRCVLLLFSNRQGRQERQA